MIRRQIRIRIRRRIWRGRKGRITPGGKYGKLAEVGI